MEDNRIYELDLESIGKDFKFKEDGEIKHGEYNLKHSQGKKIKLLPYTTKKENIVCNFTGVVGSFCRIACDKKLNNSFDVNEFINNVIELVKEFEDENARIEFKNIINSIFIKEGKLVDFNIKTMNYIESSSHEDNIAEFLFSIFIDDELKNSIMDLYDKENNNVLNKLVLKSLPDLDNRNSEVKEYKCYLPFVKELFKKDFMFLVKDEEFYRNYIQRFLEYYNMFYVSQLAVKLSQFEKADLNSPVPVYYTLSWESTSKNRTAYRLGLENIKKPISTLFSHVITLEMLNYHNLNEQLGYVELDKIFRKNNSEEIRKSIYNLIQEYKKRICDIRWEQEKISKYNSENEIFEEVYYLYKAVDFQFINSKKNRNDLYNNYQNWFIKFIEKNFGKARGSLGYNLNLNEEDIILLTKICINNNDKLKVSILFKEFEKRGIFFDRDSKSKIIALYEKLNLLEKKSDSGDAQYVKSVL